MNKIIRHCAETKPNSLNLHLNRRTVSLKKCRGPITAEDAAARPRAHVHKRTQTALIRRNYVALFTAAEQKDFSSLFQ